MAFDILPTLKTKLYSLLHSTVLYRFGYGSRVEKGVWEKQYGGTDWDFLFSEDEKEHYLAIIKQLQKNTAYPTILDIGCGVGALYQYFEMSLTGQFDYTGIDISENAVEKASAKFPKGDFKAHDYDLAPLDGKFNTIIFNEVLYYFVKPIKILDKAFADNLQPGGVIIVSMYKDLHNKNRLIWEAIAEKYEVLTEETMSNQKGTIWTVKTISQKKAD